MYKKILIPVGILVGLLLFLSTSYNQYKQMVRFYQDENIRLYRSIGDVDYIEYMPYIEYVMYYYKIKDNTTGLRTI